MMADTNIEGANYFTPCAHCGNAVLDCNFENGSDCCDRCNKPIPPRVVATCAYCYTKITEAMYYVKIDNIYYHAICNENRKSAMLNMAVTQTLPEDTKMEVTHVKNSVVVNQNLTISERVALAVEVATIAFWEVIATSFPESTSGDLTQRTTVIFETDAEKAVKEWVELNVPKKECYRGEVGFFDDLHLHYRDVWHQLHTGGGCMVAVTDNIAIDGNFRYMGVTSECVCIYTDTFEEGDFLMEHMEDCAWSFGENPTTLMNIIDEMFGGSALWNTGHLFDDIMTLGKSGKC
jgi:hypothetical protein